MPAGAVEPGRAEGRPGRSPCPGRARGRGTGDVKAPPTILVTEISESMGDLLGFALAFLTLPASALTSCHFPEMEVLKWSKYLYRLAEQIQT